jgi:hypothetical protein
VNQLYRHISVFLIAILSISHSIAQHDDKSEQELKKKARELFKSEKYGEALPLFSQLLSLYPKDPNFAYKFGACRLFAETNKSEPIKILERASRKVNVEPEVFYFLGKAYHLNYRFNEAVTAYTKYKDGVKKHAHPVEREIETCWNGMSLLKQITDIGVYEKKSLSNEDFFRAYKFDDFEGKIIKNLEEFQSKVDKSKNYSTIMHFKRGADKIYYSSYGETEDNGKDIYVITMQENGEYGDPRPLGSNINTKYDEEFPYLHPSGQILYFASKGHNSMGGYDIFKSQLSSNGSWSTPKNVDFAINTPADDYLFITDKSESTAYFASNRESKHGFVTVYKVSTDRVPVREVAIKGDFLSKDTKNAKITIENTVTGVKIDTYNTDTTNGEYVLKVPNGGKFKFYVEADKGHAVHTGFVNIPIQKTLVTLRQEISLEGEGDAEKIRIINHFGDESEEFSLIPEFLLEKASLKIDTSNEALNRANALKEMYDNMEQYDNTTDSAFSDGSIEADTMEAYQSKIVEDALNFADELQETSHTLWSDAEIAYNFAKEKKIESFKLSKESERIEPENADESKKLKKEAAKMAKEAEISFDYGDLYKAKSSSFELDAQKIILIADKITSSEDPEEKKNLTDEISQVHEELMKKHESDDFNQNYTAQIQEKKKEAAKERSKIRELEKASKELVTEITALKEKASNAKKKDRDLILQQSLELEEELLSINKTLAAEDKKVAEIEKSLALLENESELYRDVESVISKHDTSNIEHLSKAELTMLAAEIEEVESVNNYDQILVEELHLDEKSSQPNSSDTNIPLVSIQNTNDSAASETLPIDTMNTPLVSIQNTEDSFTSETLPVDSGETALVSIQNVDSSQTEIPTNVDSNETPLVSIQNNSESINENPESDSSNIPLVSIVDNSIDSTDTESVNAESPSITNTDTDSNTIDNNGFIEKTEENSSSVQLNPTIQSDLVSFNNDLETELNDIPNDGSALSEEQKKMALSNWKQKVNDQKILLEDSVASEDLSLEERSKLISQINYLDKLQSAKNFEEIKQKTEVYNNQVNNENTASSEQNTDNETLTKVDSGSSENEPSKTVDRIEKIQELIASSDNVDLENLQSALDQQKQNPSESNEAKIVQELDNSIEILKNRAETEDLSPEEKEKNDNLVTAFTASKIEFENPQISINQNNEEKDIIDQLSDNVELSDISQSTPEQKNSSIQSEIDRLTDKVNDTDIQEEEKQNIEDDIKKLNELKAIAAQNTSAQNTSAQNTSAQTENIKNNRSPVITDIKNEDELDGLAEELSADGIANDYLKFQKNEQELIKSSNKDEIQKLNEDWAAVLKNEADSLQLLKDSEEDDLAKAKIQGQIDNLNYLASKKRERANEIADFKENDFATREISNDNNNEQANGLVIAEATDSNDTESINTDVPSNINTADNTEVTDTDTTANSDVVENTGLINKTEVSDNTNGSDSTNSDSADLSENNTTGNSDINENNDITNKAEISSANNTTDSSNTTNNLEPTDADISNTTDKNANNVNPEITSKTENSKNSDLSAKAGNYINGQEIENSQFGSRTDVKVEEIDAVLTKTLPEIKTAIDVNVEDQTSQLESSAKLSMDSIIKWEKDLATLNAKLEGTKKKKKRAIIELDIQRLKDQLQTEKANQISIEAQSSIVASAGSEDVQNILDNELASQKLVEYVKAMESEISSTEENISIKTQELDNTKKKKLKRKLQAELDNLEAKVSYQRTILDKQKVALEDVKKLEKKLFARAIVENTLAPKSFPLTSTGAIDNEISESDDVKTYDTQKKKSVRLIKEAQVEYVAAEERKTLVKDINDQIAVLEEEMNATQDDDEKQSLSGKIALLTQKADELMRMADSLLNSSIAKQNEAVTNIENTSAALIALDNEYAKKVVLTPYISKEVAVVEDSTIVQKTEPENELSIEPFIKTERNQSLYNNEKPIPIDIPHPSGLVFKVQVGAFRNPIPQDLFRGFAPIMGENRGSGITRYTAGNFGQFNQANNAKEEIRDLGYSDAFVVAYLDGERITISKARQMATGTLASSNVGINDNSNATSVNEFGVTEQSVALMKGLFYTVQIGVYNRPASLSELYNINPVVSAKLDNGTIRYSSGTFNSVDEANISKNNIRAKGIRDAFVTAYFNGERISVAKAKELQNNGTPTYNGNNTSNPTNTSTEQPKGTFASNKEAKEGTFFSVQVGAYTTNIPIGAVEVYLEIIKQHPIFVEDNEGLKLYLTGLTKDFDEINALLPEIKAFGLDDAFIVGLQDGVKIEVAKAKELIRNE